MDGHVFLLNFCERQSISNSFALIPKNELTAGMTCSKILIPHEQIMSGPCMPYFGKQLDVGETAMAHFSVAQKSDLATTTEDVLRVKMTASSSRQGRKSTGWQHNDQLSLTRTSSENSCEKLQEGFVTFPKDDAYCKETKGCKSKAAQAKTDRFSDWSKKEKSTTPSKAGENFFSHIWKENAIDEADKISNGYPQHEE